MKLTVVILTIVWVSLLCLAAWLSHIDHWGFKADICDDSCHTVLPPECKGPTMTDLTKTLRELADINEQLQNARRVRSLSGGGLRVVDVSISGSTDTAGHRPKPVRLTASVAAGEQIAVIDMVIKELEDRYGRAHGLALAALQDD